MVLINNSIFIVFEFCIAVCVPLLFCHGLWVWTMKNLDGSMQNPLEPEPEHLHLDGTLLSLDMDSMNSRIDPKDEDLQVLCVIEIPTFNAIYHIPYEHVRNSWGTQCSQLQYFQYGFDYYDTSDRIRKLRQFYKVRAGSGGLEFHWVLHVIPSTYVIMENLKMLVSSYPPELPIVVGRNFKTLILSNGAVQAMLNESAIFQRVTLMEHIFTSQKLNETNLSPYRILHGHTKDGGGRETFMVEFGKTFNGSIFNVKVQLRLQKNLKYGSRRPVAFPNMEPEGFVAMDYLLHRLRVGNGHGTGRNYEHGPLVSDFDVTAADVKSHHDTRSNHSKSSFQMSQQDLNTNFLANEVKVLCMVLTGPRNHIKKALHVKRTWGRRCNILVFLSSQTDPVLKSTAFPDVREGREYLWLKVQRGFQFVYQHFYDQVDWFLKADDDTFVIMENLRMLLADYDPERAQYLGLRLKGNYTHPWVTGGAGYVLSKSALKLLVEGALAKSANDTKCPLDLLDVPEDVFTSLCLHQLNIPYVDTRDELGRQRFFQHAVKDVVNDQIPEFFYDEYQYYPIAKSMDCCSSSAISFHYISPFQMYEMEYIIYELNAAASGSKKVGYGLDMEPTEKTDPVDADAGA